MAFKMKYKNLEEIVEQLHGASKMHKEQAKKLDKHIDEMESPMKKKGLWANMHAKRKRGESPAKPGDENYPTYKALEESQSPLDKKCTCWEGHSRVPGTKPCAPGSCKKNK